MIYHDAAGIIFDMLKDYPRCSTCKEPATRRIEHALLIIGEQPRACDDDTHIPQVRDPSLVKFTELPQAELVRAAQHYLDTHAMKTSTPKAFDHSTRTTKKFETNLGFCVCEHCAKLPEHEARTTFVVEKGDKEVARTGDLGEFIAACEAAGSK